MMLQHIDRLRSEGNKNDFAGDTISQVTLELTPFERELKLGELNELEERKAAILKELNTNNHVTVGFGSKVMNDRTVVSYTRDEMLYSFISGIIIGKGEPVGIGYLTKCVRQTLFPHLSDSGIYAKIRYSEIVTRVSHGKYDLRK